MKTPGLIITTALLTTTLVAFTAAAQATDLRPQAPTPAFTLPTLDDEEVTLRNEYGLPILLIFADLEQENSLRAIEELEQIADDLGGVRGFVIAAASPEGEVPETALPILIDDDRSTFADYGVVSVLPRVVLLDADGLMHVALTGYGVSLGDRAVDELSFLTGRITREELLARREGPATEDAESTWLQRRVNFADQMRQRGLLDQAREQFEEILAEFPAEVHAHLGLAQIDLGEGELEAAASHARSALERNPELPLALKILAHIQIQQGDAEAAEETISQFIDIAGEDVETHYLMGRIAEARGDESAACDHYRRAAESLLADREWGIYSGHTPR